MLCTIPWTKTHRANGPWALLGEASLLGPQSSIHWQRGIVVGRTEHRSVVLGEDLILRPVGKHIDEIVQVPQPVGQGPDGEIPCGERLQVPQVAVSCERTSSFPQPTAIRKRIRGMGFESYRLAEASKLLSACTAAPPLCSSA